MNIASSEYASLQAIFNVASRIIQELDSVCILKEDIVPAPIFKKFNVVSRPDPNEKPVWTTLGCSTPRKTKSPLMPQFTQRPDPGDWAHTYRTNLTGFSCIHTVCKDYHKVYPTKSAAQQHAKKHYPPEYVCADCSGSWFLKTEYTQHFLIACPHCSLHIRKTSLAGHLKRCTQFTR
jgi:hypothetical protein